MRYLALFIIIIYCACQNTPKPDQTVVLEQSLQQLEKEMTASNGTVVDMAKATAFIQTAEEYAVLVQAANPEKAADLLLKAAGLAKSIGNFTKALSLYTSVSDRMPKHPKAPMALFMEGYIYENDLGDTAKARITYQAFLRTYPNDPDFADDAQNALKYLGKSPDEMLRMFDEMNKNRPQ